MAVAINYSELVGKIHREYSVVIARNKSNADRIHLEERNMTVCKTVGGNRLECYDGQNGLEWCERCIALSEGVASDEVDSDALNWLSQPEKPDKTPHEMAVEMREENDSVYIVSKKGNKSLLHEVDGEETRCGTTPTANLVEKDVSVYPPGYKRWCTHCAACRFDFEPHNIPEIRVKS